MAEDLYRRHESILPAGEPLYAAFATAVPGLSRHKARLAITAGLCTIDGALESDPQRTLEAPTPAVLDLTQGIPARGAQKRGAEAGAPAGPATRPFTILYEDQSVAVVDKAAGVLAAPTDGDSKDHLLAMLRAHWRKQGSDRFIGTVHRIDQPTSGCLVVARGAEAQRILQSQFAGHSAGRRYRCLVQGSPQRERDTLTGRIGRGLDGRRAVVDDSRPGKDAITHFEVRRRFARGSELECWLETGRTHQIRIHLAAIGCPILGDPVYGPRPMRRRDARRSGAPAPIKVPRLMLHAWKVAFDHPLGGRRVEVEAPLPAVFEQVARSLG